MLHRAGAASRPAAPKSLDEFFGGNYFSDVDRLNFSAEAPAIPKQTWAQFAGFPMNQWRDSSRVLLDRYGTFLDAEVIEELEAAVSSTAVGMMSNFGKGISPSVVIRASNMMNDHADRVARLCRLFNRSHEGTILMDLAWDRDDVAGRYGHARMSDDQWENVKQQSAGN
jgi:hypothetical protein